MLSFSNGSVDWSLYLQYQAANSHSFKYLFEPLELILTLSTYDGEARCVNLCFLQVESGSPTGLYTELEAASSAGQYDQVVTLLSQGQAHGAAYLQSSLDAAARNGHANIVSLLLSKGAEHNRDTLRAAIASNSIPVFQSLLDAGWDPSFGLGHSGTALTRAIIEDKPELVTFLLKHGADPYDTSRSLSALAQAAAHSSTNVAGILLDHGVQLNQSGALETAAYHGQLDTLGFFLDRGADINEITDNDWTGPSEREAGLGTALHVAATRGQKEAVTLLLERGADPSLKDTKGKTVLQKAGESGHEEIVELLRKRGISE